MDGERFDRMAQRMAGAIGSRRAVLSAAALAAAGAARLRGPAPVAAAVVDARCPAPRGEPDRFQRQVVAQTFEAKHGGLLVRATVRFAEGAAGTEDYWVAIHTTDAKGRPTARLLAEARVAGVAPPPSGQTTKATADFVGTEFGPAAVKKGKRYALVVRSFPFLQVNVNGGCGGTLFGFDGQTGEWRREGRFFGDLVFATFVEPA